jgi:uncharacterized membrane protein (UPF0182 family)
VRTPQDMPRRLPRTSRRTRIWIAVAVVVIIILIASLRGLARFYTDYLWFQSVHFTSVFRGVLLTKWILALVFIAVFFVLMMVNLVVADRIAPPDLDASEANELVVRYREFAFTRGRAIRIVTSLIFALLAGVGTSREWNNWDLFRYHVNFGVTDPQFHRDVGFYVFQLPFIRFLITWTFEAVIVTLIVTAVVHYLNGGILPQAAQRRVSSPVKAHLSVLLAVLALIKAVAYYYDRLALDLSRQHVVNGATATNVHADAPAKVLLIFIALISAALFLANIRQRGWMLPAVGVALWFLVSILVGAAYPAIYQALSVSPSEATKERPYIQRNIDATRHAYELDGVQTVNNYNYSPTLSSAEVTGSTAQNEVNQQTLSNVRLLDPAVNLLNTFNKYQALRSYYSFNELNLDRYDLDINGTNQETATVSSVRELNNQVPSGFVNQHLEYTHGYGAVLAPVSESGVNQADGTPNFVLSGLPPVGSAPAQLTPSGSQIYYGLGPDTGGYVIAKSKTPELDYENNLRQQVQTHYAGTGGVEAGSILRRAAFALRFGDANFILSGQITPSSRVMYIRNIAARVQKAAPFLKFDSDPYSVILNGNVYWVIDGYTVTDNYPYSQNANLDSLPPGSGLQTTFNYVRNSVKVVVSAYDGSMHFFAWDPKDPILRVYERAFPDLFIPGSQADKIIPGITAHFRYPENIFQIQTNMFGRYHLTTPSDFYSQAQAWAVSPDPGSGQLTNSNAIGAAVAGGTGTLAPTVARLQPQYVLAALPNQSNPSVDFLLITPFVPISATGSSQNLTAFMTASSDPGTYGQLKLFQLPAGTTVDGPGLISNAIKSNTAISQELTFYNQQGSQVELGEVAIIPIDQTLIYVQPMYLESSTNRIPTLKDVIVVYNGNAYHSQNASLDNALCQITNKDGSKPFANYCNTAAATSPSLISPTTGAPGSSSTPGSTTTTTPSTTTTLPPTTAPAGSGPPPGSTVQSLLAQANSYFAQAQAALKNGDLATYQKDVNQAQTYVQWALQLPGG